MHVRSIGQKLRVAGAEGSHRETPPNDENFVDFLSQAVTKMLWIIPSRQGVTKSRENTRKLNTATIGGLYTDYMCSHQSQGGGMDVILSDNMYRFT